MAGIHVHTRVLNKGQGLGWQITRVGAGGCLMIRPIKHRLLYSG